MKAKQLKQKIGRAFRRTIFKVKLQYAKYLKGDSRQAVVLRTTHKDRQIGKTTLLIKRVNTHKNNVLVQGNMKQAYFFHARTRCSSSKALIQNRIVNRELKLYLDETVPYEDYRILSDIGYNIVVYLRYVNKVKSIEKGNEQPLFMRPINHNYFKFSEGEN